MTDRKTGPLTPDEVDDIRLSLASMDAVLAARPDLVAILDVIGGAPDEVVWLSRLIATLDAEREAHARTVAEMPRAVAGALFDFIGALTTSPATIMCGAIHDSPPVLDALTEWAKTRGLVLDNPDVEGWHDDNPGADALRAYVERETAAKLLEQEEAFERRTANLRKEVSRLKSLTRATPLAFERAEAAEEEASTLRAELARVEAERDAAKKARDVWHAAEVERSLERDAARSERDEERKERVRFEHEADTLDTQLAEALAKVETLRGALEATLEDVERDGARTTDGGGDE